MPELPEVEVTRRSFADRIAGARVTDVFIGKPLRWGLGCASTDLVGRRVVGVQRRGKYLLIELDTGLLLVHLGMSGSLSFVRQLPQRGVHDHFELHTDQGALRLHDPRRFGAVVFAQGADDPMAHKLLGNLGMEPLGEEFDLKVFQAGLKRRQVPIKQVLLAGQLVVGVGNIYASEALFLAHIRPTRRAARLTRAQVQGLHGAIREVLSLAVRKGGSTLRDFSSADGEAGHFQVDAMVYGRAGLPCRVCGTAIKLIKQGQRASYFCPKCQPA